MEIKEVKAEVLRLLAEGPKSRGEIIEQSTEFTRDDAQQVSNALFQLKNAGDITRDDDARYRLAEGAEPGAAAVAPAAAPAEEPQAATLPPPAVVARPEAEKKRLGRPVVRAEVLRLLSAQGKVARAEFVELSETLQGAVPDEISDALHQLKREKVIVIGPDGYYRLAGIQADDPTYQLLRRNADATRQAAQTYIDNLDDPVLGQLLAAAEQAHQALNTYVNQAGG
ncbi:MAG: hypothetical protein AB1450_13380 [Pseudomonadota bacterium]